MDKGCVYEINCIRCEHNDEKAVYIGESGLPMQERSKTHVTSVETGNKKPSAWTEHYIQCHPTHQNQPLFRAKKLCAPQGHVRRKIREAMAIAEIPPTVHNVNRFDEGNKVNTILLRTDAEGRQALRWTKWKAFTGKKKDGQRPQR